MTIPRNVFITRREFIGRKIEELTERGLKQLAKARYIGKKVDDTIDFLEKLLENSEEV